MEEPPYSSCTRTSSPTGTLTTWQHGTPSTTKTDTSPWVRIEVTSGCTTTAPVSTYAAAAASSSRRADHGEPFAAGTHGAA